MYFSSCLLSLFLFVVIHPPSGIDDHSRFWLSCLSPFVFLVAKTFNHLSILSERDESSFFFWSLFCLSFFDLRILITLLVSSNYSYCRNPSFVCTLLDIYILFITNPILITEFYIQSKNEYLCHFVANYLYFHIQIHL